MHPSNLSISDFTYELPSERIASYPLTERDASKLLIYQRGKITHDIYKNVASHLPENALLIFNKTKVVEARLLFQKPSGAVIEIFCLEPHSQYRDITAAMAQRGKVWWQCLVGGASKWKHGQVLEKTISLQNEDLVIQASYVEKLPDSFVIELRWSDATMSFAEMLHHTGAIPLPPYIKRKPEPTDATRYQTIYAETDGSVAAPTAGLHFTPVIFESLEEKNIKRDFVTLHVGAGTFKPVKAAIMKEHEMHAEFIDVSVSTIENILENLDQAVVAVGTTSLRTIESLYWLGVKIANGDFNEIPEIDQWEPYENSTPMSTQAALEKLLLWMQKKSITRLVTKTRIIIAPGYRARVAKALITNFHQPQSTLLLLVAALTGDNWKKIYEQAMQNDYRFLSYGDGSLLWIDQ